MATRTLQKSVKKLKSYSAQKHVNVKNENKYRSTRGEMKWETRGTYTGHAGNR